MNRGQAGLLALTVAALALLGWGAWWIYPPAAPLTVGMLLWIDAELWARRGKK